MYRISSWPIRIIVLGLFWGCLIPADVMAIDEEGCLTCHQYPGLARHDSTGGIKILHIDEQNYMASTHGELRCRECHDTVRQVPHTDEAKVTCSIKCHQGENSPELPEDYKTAAFHVEEQSGLLRLDEATSCRGCHPLYPHTADNRVRALLNLHTGFMTCEVCHINRKKFPSVTHHWVDTENAVFTGTPFGTYFNPKTGKAAATEHFISRIALFSKKNGSRFSLSNTHDRKTADQFARQSKNLSEEEKKEKLSYFHRDIEKKEVSIACDGCHAPTGLLDFKELGFTDRKSDHLRQLNIKGMVSKYQTFYFPSLFE